MHVRLPEVLWVVLCGQSEVLLCLGARQQGAQVVMGDGMVRCQPGGGGGGGTIIELIVTTQNQQ